MHLKDQDAAVETADARVAVPVETLGRGTYCAPQVFALLESALLEEFPDR